MADAKGIRAGRAFVELGVSDKLTRGLRKAQARLKAFGNAVRSIGARLAINFVLRDYANHGLEPSANLDELRR